MWPGGHPALHPGGEVRASLAGPGRGIRRGQVDPAPTVPAPLDPHDGHPSKSSSNVASLTKPVAPKRSFCVENRNDHPGPRASCAHGPPTVLPIKCRDCQSVHTKGTPLTFDDPPGWLWGGAGRGAFRYERLRCRSESQERGEPGSTGACHHDEELSSKWDRELLRRPRRRRQPSAEVESREVVSRGRAAPDRRRPAGLLPYRSRGSGVGRQVGLMWRTGLGFTPHRTGLAGMRP